MATKCTPPLNFVQNGAAGSAFPPPLDPTPPSFAPPSPTFEESACSLLGADLCAGMDPLSALDELPALADAVDVLTTAADANLDAILLELDQLGQDKVGQAFDDFSGAQPGASSLLGDVTGLAEPAIGQVPIVGPGGSTVVNLGAPPAQGGAPSSGAPPYVLHWPVPLNPAVPGALLSSRLEGPNPPFAGLNGFDLEANTQGKTQSFALLEINPAQAGTFNATIHYRVHISITGIDTIVDASVPVTVVVE